MSEPREADIVRELLVVDHILESCENKLALIFGYDHDEDWLSPTLEALKLRRELWRLVINLSESTRDEISERVPVVGDSETTPETPTTT